MYCYRTEWTAVALTGCIAALTGCMADGASDAAGDAPSEERELDRARIDPLREPLQRGLDTLLGHGMVGSVAEISDGSRRLQARSGVARLDHQDPIAFDSRFRMGSNTKTFVAVVMLQLVEEGKVGLDDTVDHWLPGLVSGNGNDGTRITIRNLLQHTSGLVDYLDAVITPTFNVADYRRIRFQHRAAEQLVGLAMARPPNFAPGTQWSYSNTNYVLAGLIIKTVTGHDWSFEVRARILAPLGLSQTFDPGDWPGLPEPHAEGYQTFTSDGPLVDVTLLNHTVADAAGALVTTTRDLTRFWRALQGGELLGPAAMAKLHDTVEATELQVVFPGIRYGLGIMWSPKSCGGGYWWHGGDTFGFTTRNAVSDDATRAVVISENTTVRSASAQLQFIADEHQMVDDVMCASR